VGERNARGDPGCIPKGLVGNIRIDSSFYHRGGCEYSKKRKQKSFVQKLQKRNLFGFQLTVLSHAALPEELKKQGSPVIG
jgi:hypothetical protein